MTEPANSSEPAQRAKCPVCDAHQRPGDTRCWLCGAVVPNTSDGEDRFSGPGPSAPHAEPNQGFSLASLMMFVTLFSVVLGTITIAPGLGIPLAFVAFFTWINTATVVHRRAAKGVKLTSGERALLFIRSFVSTVGLLALLGLAAVAALMSAIYTTCTFDGNEVSPTYAALAVTAAVVAASAIFAFVMLIRSKLRRRRREKSDSP